MIRVHPRYPWLFWDRKIGGSDVFRRESAKKLKR
jgi:hypothetical protein